MTEDFIREITSGLSQCPRNGTVDYIYATLAEWLREQTTAQTPLPTVRTLAERLGIARQTVSKVYLRLAHEKQIERTPGKRRWSRVSLSGNPPPCLGLILPDDFARVFFPGTREGRWRLQLYNGIVEAAAAAGYATLPLYPPPPGSSAGSSAAFLATLAGRFSGLLHFGNRAVTPDPVLHDILASNALPQVTITCDTRLPHVGAATFDQAQAIALIYAHLAAYGHRRIAIVKQRGGNTASDFSYALQSLPEIRALFVQAGASPEALSELTVATTADRMGLLAMDLHRLLSQPLPPTAFWCRNDNMAIDLMHALTLMGYAVPRDFSVIGFDNSWETIADHPHLSTVQNPLFDIGREGVGLLLENLRRGDHLSAPPRRVPVTLVPRLSVGPVAEPVPTAGGASR